MPSCCCLRRVCEPRSKSFSKFQACSGVLMEMTHRRGCLTQILTQKRRTAKGGFKRFVRRPVFFQTGGQNESPWRDKADGWRLRQLRHTDWAWFEWKGWVKFMFVFCVNFCPKLVRRKTCVERWTWRRPAASAAGAAVGGRRAEKSDMFGRDLCLKLASTIGLCLSVWLHSWVNQVLRTTSSTFTRSVLLQKFSVSGKLLIKCWFGLSCSTYTSSP